MLNIFVVGLTFVVTVLPLAILVDRFPDLVQCFLLIILGNVKLAWHNGPGVVFIS